MGTRSTITFTNRVSKGAERPYVKIYQQYDGYLEGVGLELCSWILNKKIVNGYSVAHKNGEYVNGLGCMAAQFIHDFKNGIGNLYIYPCSSGIDKNCDYNYEVIYNYTDYPDERPANDLITIRVNNWNEPPFFEGSPAEFLKYIKEYKEDDE